jgi:hypothetical protein
MVVAAGLLLFACYDVVDERGAGGDSGKSDAGASDSGMPDAGLPDAGRDTGHFDIGSDTSDSSDLSDTSDDAGTPDSGLMDAGQDAGGDVGPDAGFDAGPDDTGDAGSDPCADHCSNQKMDCGEAGVDCGGGCGACPDPCDGHCFNAKADCGEAGKDCGGECSPCGSGGCSFPQGVPEEDFVPGTGNDGTIAAAVNAVMEGLSGCGVGSDCYIGDQYPDAQQWFVAVAQALRDQGFCAGQHELGYTDEIAVSNTGCTGRWYGYHIYNYGGSKVVWNPGAQRGWWAIEAKWCAGI